MRWAEALTATNRLATIPTRFSRKKAQKAQNDRINTMFRFCAFRA
jgi:hypothetical protein